MNKDMKPLERAFELAEGGKCRSITDIKKQLRSEGFSIDQITGPMLTRQLMKLVKKTLLAAEGPAAE